MMQYYEMTNFERVEKLLADVNSRSKKITNQASQDKSMTYATGKLGADVTFTVKSVHALNPQDKTPYQYTYEEVELVAQGQPLATLGRKNGFLNLEQKRKPVPTTIFWVVSPQYDDHGIATKTMEAVNQLYVFHSADQTAEGVIDEICDVVAYSKAKAAADKKYGRLNIATRLADLTMNGNVQDNGNAIER